MNPAKGLLDGECGQPNALVRVGRQMVQDASSAKVRTFLGPLQPPARPEDEMAKEFLAQFGGTSHHVPTTFSMQGLLDEVNRLDAGGSSAGADAAAVSWSREYLNTASAVMPLQNWSQEYLQQEKAAAGPDTIFDDVWQRGSIPPAELKWSAEYLTEAENASALAERNAADPAIIEGIREEDKLWNTEFMQFMGKVDRGEVRIDGDHAVENDVPLNAGEAASIEEQAVRGEDHFWEKLETEWEDLARNSEAHRWLAEYDSLLSMYKNYNLAAENPYLEADDPLTLGKRHMSAGDLANAVLCFEAAVQRQPESSEAWLCLSRAQTENEQEARAIAAANKCLEIDPKNLDALLTLSTAYANESLFDSSCRTLAQWLAAHPKYKDFASADIIDGKGRHSISSFMDQSIFSSVEGAFLEAARSNTAVDPDLQNCLGVLYNLSGDTERAVDCFHTALMVQPKDARLWNRLGATLANGGRSAEAVSAYRKALELYPGFVRARYNLGISCLNLNASREAIDHFLSALSLQMRGVGPTNQSVMSDSIWGTLRVAISGLRRDDWLSLVDNRDFDGLRQVFNSPATDSLLPGSHTR